MKISMLHDRDATVSGHGPWLWKAAAAAAVALVVAAASLAPAAEQAGPPLADGVAPEQADAVVDDLLASGVIDDESEVLAISDHGVALRGDPTEAWASVDVTVTSSAARTSTKGGGGKDGGGKDGGGTKGGGGGRSGKGGSTGGSTTVVIGDGGSGGSSDSYSLLSGVGLLTGYQVTAASGTPRHLYDGLVAAAGDSALHTGSTMTPGSGSTGWEPLNGEIRISESSTTVCGTDQAAGCTTTWYDGTRVLKAEVRIRDWVDPMIARCLIGHELGHGLGLGHVSDASQLMNSVWIYGSSPCTFQAGDAAGLATMGSVKSTL
jgi:hypothetical protein